MGYLPYWLAGFLNHQQYVLRVRKFTKGEFSNLNERIFPLSHASPALTHAWKTPGTPTKSTTSFFFHAAVFEVQHSIDLLPRKQTCPQKNSGWKVHFLLGWSLLEDIRSFSGVVFDLLLPQAVCHFRLALTDVGRRVRHRNGNISSDRPPSRAGSHRIPRCQNPEKITHTSMEEIGDHHLGCIKPCTVNTGIFTILVSRISEPSTVGSMGRTVYLPPFSLF